MDISLILTYNYSDSEWVLNGDDYSGLTWLSDTPQPTKEALEKQWPAVQAEIAKREQAKIDSKDSAIKKLRALGLSVDEVEAAFGLKS